MTLGRYDLLSKSHGGDIYGLYNTIKRGNGEHIQDTTIRQEMKTATQGFPMILKERQKTTSDDRLQLPPI